MTRAQAFLTLAVCLSASAAAAQEPPPILSTAPARFARWDVSGHVTWRGERRPADDIVQWDRWFGVAAGGGSVGYYWTSHLKMELDLSASNEGDHSTFVTIAIPGQTAPLFVQRDHETRFTTASAGLVGQFFENVWFHPFVNAGFELVREREHIETVPPPVPPRGPTFTPTPASETRVRYSGRPYAGAGFKAYISERTFFRTEIRTTWSSEGLSSLGWRSGIGVDF
jgi:hypothetical protein